MEGKQVFPAAQADHRHTVVVELSAEGTAHIRQAPQDVLVMFVQSKEILPQGKRSVAAGAGGPILAPEANGGRRPRPREIPVSFPG